MVKTGPCRHCGVTSTPLWRNGPPEKPVLCNACGSRWRTKGSLTNYTPLHAREAFEAELKVPKIKSLSFKHKEQKSHKKKQTSSALESEYELPYCDQNFRKIVARDTSNRSSSGSAISYSESCAHFGNNDASDITGSAQSNAWDPLVPSKKRTFVTRPKPPPVEKLTKDLYTILHEHQSSNLSGSSEDDLIYESGTPMGSCEIGYGSVLIRHPNSKSVEEESEASSFPIEIKLCMTSEAYSGLAPLSVHIENKGTSYCNTDTDKLKKSTAQIAQGNTKREKCSSEMYKILQDRDSPLISADLNDVINFDGFMKYLTHEEQQQLMKYLPPIDTYRLPESLKGMFRSPQFLETMPYFQKLLQEGIFDLSFPGSNADTCSSLKSYILHNLTKSEWVEYYIKLKDGFGKQIKGIKEIPTRQKFAGFTKLASMKRPHVIQNRTYSEHKSAMRSPKRAGKFGAPNVPSKCTAQLNSSDAALESTDDIDGFVDNEGACFSPRSLFASPPVRSSMMAPLQFTADSSDHDVLVDVPCNASFPEAELLYHSWKDKTASNGSPAESGVAEAEESLSYFPSSSIISTKLAEPR